MPMGVPKPPPPPPSGGEDTLLAGRYRLLERLFGNAASEVYRARDELSDRDVAVKRLGGSALAPHLRAEASALRLLRLPGVARLLDEGASEHGPFLVMELVEGTPFPGGSPPGKRTWDEVQQTAVALLEILARVHVRGVVHRDLKPDNVLVDAEKRPVVLDFGLSAGPAIGSGLGGDARAVGTPAYAAPEQILGAQADARSDLYAFGVMLYEVLTGRAPQQGTTPDEFLQARLHGSAPALRTRAPDVPGPVARLVDDLLARDPGLRPRSAAEALARLRCEPWSDPDPGLPWIGGEARVAAAQRVLAASRVLDVRGDPGTGRTRLLDELDRRFEADGVRAIRLSPGDGPLSGLGGLSGTDAEHAADLDAALSAARLAVDRALERGSVILVDDWDALDRWSRDVLEARLRSDGPAPGCVVRVRGRGTREEPGVPGMRLDGFDEHELRELFVGPDRLFHLREDGARELWRRTGGRARRVAEEVAAWERAGLVRRTPEGLRIERRSLALLATGFELAAAERVQEQGERELAPALEELLAWIVIAGPQASSQLLARARDLPPWRLEAEELELVEAGVARRAAGGTIEPLVHARALDEWTPDRRIDAHARLAEHLEPGSEGRLLHLVSARRFRDVPDEACVVARRLLEVGRLAEGEAALTEGLLAVRHQDEPEAELQLIGDWMAVALAGFSPQALDRVLYELARAEAAAERFPLEVERLDRFGRAAQLTLGGKAGARALAELESLEPFEDLELERWRMALCVQAARGTSAQREKLVLERIARAWRDHPSPLLRASVSEWQGRLCYRQEKHLEAAEHFEHAAQLAERPNARLSAMLNGASALLEACAFDRAAQLAEAARDLAASCRHLHYEVRAEWCLRSAAYRSGRAIGPDLELVEAASSLGVSDQEALICLNEAAVAWRGGHPEAAGLALRAAQCWAAQGKLAGAVLARCLAAACGGDAELEPLERRSLAERAAGVEDATVAGQALALLGGEACEGSAEARRVAQTLRREQPRELRAGRREVLSIDEVLAALEGSEQPRACTPRTRRSR